MAKKLFDIRVDKALKDTKFNHSTKSLRTYACSEGLTPRLKELVHRAEFVAGLPKDDLLAFVLAMDNQFRNASIGNTINQYFEIENYHNRQPGSNYKFNELNYLSDKNILTAYRKMKPETLDGWREAIEKIDDYFKLVPYTPRFRRRKDKAKATMEKLLNSKTPIKAISVNSASPSEWRKKLRTNGGD